MAYKKMTSVTFEVLNQMSECLFQNQKKLNFSQVQKKVADYLVTNGEKKFIEVFNETQENKNYKKALDTFKI